MACEMCIRDRRVNNCQQRKYQSGEAAIVPGATAMSAPHEQPNENEAGKKSCRGVHPAPAHQPTACCREILCHCHAERRGRKERVAERGERAGDAYDHDDNNSGYCAEGGSEPDVAAQIARGAAEKMRSEREDVYKRQGCGAGARRLEVWRG